MLRRTGRRFSSAHFSFRFRDAQSEGAGELGGFRVVAEREEGRVGFAGETGEPHGDAAREDRRAVEHDQPEGAAPQQHVGAPRAARGTVGTHDPQAVRCSARVDVRPVARRERATGVDVGHPPAGLHRALDHSADEGGLAAPLRADEFGEAADGETAARQGGVECGDAGGETGRVRFCALYDGRELLT